MRSVCSRASAALQRVQSDCKAAELDKRTAQETITLHHLVRVLTRELKESRGEAALQAFGTHLCLERRRLDGGLRELLLGAVAHAVQALVGG